MTDEPRHKLAYYSSIPCEPTFGGPLQIYRHFRERKDFDLIDLNVARENLWSDWIGERVASSSIFQRLSNTRLYPWFLSRAYTTRLRRESEILAARIQASGAQAVVTVAYGRRCYVARNAAQLLGLPLITFYHDWWPDLVHAKTPRTHAFMDQQFRALAGESDLIFPVSNALLEELGGHSNAPILPPIPATRAPMGRAKVEGRESREKRRLVYAGTLQGPYGKMVRELAFALLQAMDSKWELKAYGPANDWPPNEKEQLIQAGVYGGMLQQGEELDNALAGADALLVVMNFESNDRRRVRTSFPSKFLDYLSYSKPIMVWGPEECAATEWTMTHRLGPVFTTPDASGVSSSLNGEGIAMSAWNGWTKHCEMLAAEFTADSIHASLVSAFTDVLSS